MDSIFLVTILILGLCFLALSWFAGSDAPYVPTSEDGLSKLFQTIKIRRGQVFYELGSGDGRVVLEAAKKGASAFGIEQSWIRVLYSRWKAKKLALDNAHFFHGNIFDRNYYPADIIFIYLLPKGIEKLEQKLQKELKRGSIVITQTYHFKNWQPVKKEGRFWIYQV